MSPEQGAEAFRELVNASWAVIASWRFSASESVNDAHLRQQLVALHTTLKKVAPR